MNKNTLNYYNIDEIFLIEYYFFSFVIYKFLTPQCSFY